MSLISQYLDLLLTVNGETTEHEDATIAVGLDSLMLKMSDAEKSLVTYLIRRIGKEQLGPKGLEFFSKALKDYTP